MSRFLLFCVAFFSLYTTAFADSEDAIVAVVNDSIISSSDVADRMQLVMATTNLTDTEEVRNRVRPQVIRGLIAEALQKQEADRQSITVTNEDVQAAIKDIEHQRGRPPGSLMEFFAASHVPKETFIHQLEVQIAWNKLVNKTIRPKIHVSEEDIDLARRIAPSADASAEVQIAILTLPVEKPEQEPEVRQLADKLASELAKGAQFEAVAQQFSTRISAIIEPFWIAPAQLDSNLAKALSVTKPGTTTPPVRTLDGYSIAKVYDRRAQAAEPSNEEEMLVKDILIKMDATASATEAKAMEQVARDIGKNPGDCRKETIADMDNLKDLNIAVELKRAQGHDMTPTLQQMLAKVPTGGVSEPVATPEGIRIFMICERKQVKNTLDYEKVRNQLLEQKLMLEAQKYLRNLRRDAFVDVRE